MTSDLPPKPTDTQQPRWRPLGSVDRRVLGVLVEKAKTTPDAYPMSVSALRSGCNQKNNRYPLLELELEDIEEALARLRAVGAVTEVQGSSRVARYRHYGYEWLGVDKVELGVMAELLLRGAQTEGELRGRAARMDPIPDLNALRPVLTSLTAKGLVISLTPEGRGHVVTHALYEPRELEKLRAEFHAARPAHEPAAEEDAEEPRSTSPPVRTAPAATHSTAAPAAVPQEVAQLRQELDELREQVAQVRKDLDDLWSNFR